MDEQILEQVIKEVVSKMSNSQGGSATSSYNNSSSTANVTCKDYPLGEKRPELIKTPSGKPLNSISLDDVIKGNVVGDDLRITADTLEMQASIAESVGRIPLALNLRRAKELTRIPDERILEIYNSLRPGRSTKQELLAIGDELDNKYSASVTANFVREACSIYEKRGLLKK